MKEILTEKDDAICVSFDFDDTLAEYSSAGWDGYVLVCIPKFLDLQ